MKVISFSLWGGCENYLRGAVENARLARAIYPGWHCRFYVSGIPVAVICDLLSLAAQVVACEPANGWHGLGWRLRVDADPLVERWLIRDADSRITERESAAVHAWIASGLPVHVMRDHPYHSRAIMGGMWGAVRGAVPGMSQRLAAAINGFGTYDADQNFLESEIWPIVKERAMIHEMATFPTPRKGFEFVGERISADGMPDANDRERLRREIKL